MELSYMLSPPAVLSLLAVLLVLPAIISLISWGKRRLRTVRLVDEMPGPRSLPLLGSFTDFWGVKREDFFAKFLEMTNKYSPIVRYWQGPLPDIHLTRAEDVEIILSSTTHNQKSALYAFLRPWLGDGLLLSSGKKWHARRKMTTPTFHFKILESFHSVFVEKSNVLVDILKNKVDSTEGFDISPYITLCTLDIICETAMGTSMDAQHQSDSPYVKAINEISDVILKRSIRPWLYFDFIFFRSKEGKEFSRHLAVLHDFTNKVIQERKNMFQTKKPNQNEEENSEFGTKKRLAFLDLLLEANTGSSALTDDDIREEVDTFMFGGHDTTSSGIGWVLFLLGIHLDVQEKAAEELDAIFQGSDRPPNMQDLAEMKYLERVIKETLRLYSPIPIIGRRVNEDIKIDKYTIPAGSDVSILIYQVHRNPEYFPNPNKFDPDHFLPERVKGRHPYAYIPFSAGSRNCIGQKYAMLEEKVVLSTLLRNYSFKSVDRREDIKLLAEIVLRPAQGIRVCMKRRNTS